ncbi:MAG: hypothetical protein ACOYXS_03730 [Chloroflexota bacterium]
MADLERSGYSEFDRLLVLVRRTREVLDVLIGQGELPAGGADYLAGATLPHLEHVEAGFRGWLRASEAGLAELQYLVLQAAELRLGPPRSPAERRAATAESAVESAFPGRSRAPIRRADAWTLLGLAHTRLVLAFMPRLPEEQVRYPAGRRTYADIAVPRGPAELMDRIEELERQLWRVATGRRPRPLDPAFRRTYGFFDAADRLAGRAFGRLS